MSRFPYFFIPARWRRGTLPSTHNQSNNNNSTQVITSHSPPPMNAYHPSTTGQPDQPANRSPTNDITKTSTSNSPIIPASQYLNEPAQQSPSSSALTASNEPNREIINNSTRLTRAPTTNPNTSRDLQQQQIIDSIPTTNQHNGNSTPPSIMPTTVPTTNILTATTNDTTIQSRLTYTDEHNTSIGDILSQQKDPDHLRIYFQNIHGISKNLWLDWTNAGKKIKELNIDIIGTAETNMLWTESVRRRAQHLMKQSVQTQTHIATSSSIDAGLSDYQPGGTATGIFGKWTGRIITTTNDKSGMGRWSGFILNTKNNMKLIILTVYIPTKTEGNNTTYQQQWRILRNKFGGDPDPRKHLLTDLEAAICKWMQSGYEVIMMVDSNENITKSNSKILPFLARTKLTPLNHLFPEASYDRGSKCIDFIFGTAQVKTATIRSGYTSFYDGIWNSDHRGIFVDISTKGLFHGETPDLQRTQSRNLSSKNKSQVDKFIKHLEKSKKIDGLLDQIRTLQRTDTPWDEQTHRELEDIDIAFTKTLLQAEKKCALPHNASWHPTLHKCYLIQQYWRTAKSGIANWKNVTSQLQSLKKQIEPPADIYQLDTTRSITRQLKLATKNVREQRRLSIQKRKEFLNYKQEIQILEGKKEKAAAIATIQNAELRAITFRKYHVYTKPPHTPGGISHIIKEAKDGTRTRIQDKKLMEKELYERNRIHFAQAAHTPFASQQVQQYFTHSGVSEMGEKILRGEELPEDINKTVKEILRELKAVRSPISHDMSFESMISGFGKWREATTTSPSAKHLGIYKTLVQYHQLAERQKIKQTIPENMSDIATKALQIQHLLINLAIIHTHTYERWKVIHNFFIEKTPGVPLINKLRVIHLYEADWNLILKFFLSYKLTHLACKDKTVTQEQAGGRLGRSASDMATKTIITHELCRLQ